MEECWCRFSFFGHINWDMYATFDKSMSNIGLHYMVVLLIWALNPMAAAQSGLKLTRTGGSVRNSKQRDISCRENLEHPHDNICCLNCLAGTYVKAYCTRALERGTCETCEFDTYTEHGNGLRQCLKCTTCHSDQVTTKACTITQDRECRCKPGLFCAPDQACEVCQKCLRCKENEVRLKNCTATSNTVCKARLPTSSTISAGVVVIVVAVLGITAAIAAVHWKRRNCCKRRDSQNNPSETLKIEVDDQNNRSIEQRQNNRSAVQDDTRLHPLLELTLVVGANTPSADEDNGLGDSLHNTTNSSQSSLSALPSSSPLSSPSAKRQPGTAATEDVLRKLAPLNGDESLKKSFELFEELDVYYHNRFFRHIGLSDNAIKSTAHLHPEDRVYELLKVWLEMVGRQADMNDLIKALLYLDQKLSAENIIYKAIENGYYEYAVN
ncbi:tumor necrosis factor receptor superfamily member 10B isoform X2 [Salmo salar]|uniref:Tumor necrosis factor receptor superfamily member 10B isoform X2 n=1 Tax=Salmo salar TaxID=8030 RepID=A0A1S3PET5_SALSA|nr:tumor necrosis factor receptor superfamily member 10B-like isoform X2 [Salmo salar]|eukprot:XP_014026115.1 PREDICTED: tumor necrosis factor receptor superfamily member 10B-like isoform X2 [Salmo salar]